MDSTLISLIVVFALLVACDLAAARWGYDSRSGSQPERDWN
jgi:hypothetical protein